MKNIKDNNSVKIDTFSTNVIINKPGYRYLYLWVALIIGITIPLFLPKTIVKAETSAAQFQLNDWLKEANNAYVSGNYEKAVSIWLKIVEEQKPRATQLATVYLNLASVYWHTGRSAAAVEYWQKSLKIYRKIKTRNSDEKIAAILVDTARAYNDLGQPRFSIPLVIEAISITENKKLAQDSSVSPFQPHQLQAHGFGIKNIAYLTLGNAYTIQDKYNLAIDAYQNSLKDVKQTNSNLQIVVWNNLSKAYWQQASIARQKAIATEENEGLPASKLWQQVKRTRASAWQAAKKATDIKSDSFSLVRVEALLQRAKIAKDDAPKLSDATNSLLEAESILSILPDSHHKVSVLIELSQLTEDYDSRSKSILDSAVEIAQKINNPRVSSFAFGAMGKHHESQLQYNKALYWTKQAQFKAQQVQALDSLYQWDWQAARIYNSMKKTKAAIESYERAIAALQSIRTNTTQSQGDPLSKFQSDVEPIYRGLIQLLLSSDSSQSKIKQALQTKDLLLLSELENFFEDDCFQLETFTEIDKLAYLKKTKTAIVNTIVLSDRTYIIWQMPDGKLKKYVINIARKRLQKLVNQWRFDLENKENDNYLALSQQLYKLFLPQEIKLRLNTLKLENLIFVNDGILRNVPMAALHDGKEFLIENYAIANSLGLDIQVKQSKPKIEKALAFGLTKGINDFPPLPYVKQEIEQLGKIVNEKDFVNDKFTKKNFKQQIESNKSSLVHVATHGQFGGSYENTFLQTYQGKINLAELEETLSTHNINFPNNPILLLVLSACDTATGASRATLGMSGVAARAGVENILGSLWSVNDRQIVALIDNFYHNWIKDELSLSEALRQAQLDLIKSPDYHPSNWSSMILLQ